MIIILIYFFRYWLAIALSFHQRLLTTPPGEKIAFNEDTGELRLRRIFTSGNIVPTMRVRKKPLEETSFYYIEPGVQQVIILNPVSDTTL